MNKQNCTSSKLSKLLAEGGFKGKSEYSWSVRNDFIQSTLLLKNDFLEQSKHLEQGDVFPAYDILNDLCVNYAKEMFGDTEIEGDEVDLQYMPITREILFLHQQGKKQEAEDYIWEHCLFNPKNK